MGSEEAIADEKACLFAGMRAGRSGRAQPRQSRTTTGWCGMPAASASRASSASAGSEAAEARLLACRLQDSGSDVVALIHGRRIEYRLGAAGEHWVLNSLAALAVAEALGADVVAGGGGARRGRRPRRAAARGGGSKFGARHGRAARRELQRQPGFDAGDARGAGAHRAGAGRPPPAGAGRHARAGRAGRRLPCRPGRCGGGERRGAGLPVRPAHGGAVAQALPPAQQGVHRPDSAALAGEVAAALQGRGRDRGQGLAGLENEEWSSMPSWRQAAARRDAEDVLQPPLSRWRTSSARSTCSAT